MQQSLDKLHLSVRSTNYHLQIKWAMKTLECYNMKQRLFFALYFDMQCISP